MGPIASKKREQNGFDGRQGAALFSELDPFRRADAVSKDQSTWKRWEFFMRTAAMTAVALSALAGTAFAQMAAPASSHSRTPTY
jgi:hypothetical protein